MKVVSNWNPVTGTKTKIHLGSTCMYDAVYAIIEQCVDSEDWSWTIEIEGGEFGSGTSSSHDMAVEKAKQCWEEHLEEIEEA